MTILSDNKILEEIRNHNIVYHNPAIDSGYNLKNINSCSVDITLGEYYYEHEPDENLQYFNPKNSEHIKKYWGDWKEAKASTNEDCEKFGLCKGQKYIMLRPGQSILGHTQEYVGGKNNITTMISTKSSMGRCNLTICRDSFFGDINYITRWTLEITNNSPIPMILEVGSRIGKITFVYTTKTDSKYRGKYQTDYEDISSLCKNWKPESMLPKI